MKSNDEDLTMLKRILLADFSVNGKSNGSRKTVAEEPV